MNNIEAIKLLATGIEKHIDSLDLDKSYNLYEYRLKDFLQLDTVIRKCTRCGKLFVPKLGSIGIQQYCSDDCRYNSTLETRKIIKQDEKYHKIDSLRKLIYEKKYRAKRDNKPLKENISIAYEEILKDLKHLTRIRNKIPTKQFNKEYDILYAKYKLNRNW